MDAQQQQELIEFLRNNLEVKVSCGYDGCDSPGVTVYISMCGETISSSHDWLPHPESFNRYDEM